MRPSVLATLRGKINGRTEWVNVMDGLVAHGNERCPYSNKVRKGDILDGRSQRGGKIIEKWSSVMKWEGDVLGEPWASLDVDSSMNVSNGLDFHASSPYV